MEEAQQFAIAFAGFAAEAGWTPRALAAFCDRRGIPPAERRRRWPQGVRSVGWDLNAYADAQMVADGELEHRRSLREILLRRFDANAAFKPAVRRLAWSDLRHPCGTLRRTASTAELMWLCRDGALPLPGVRGRAKVWGLVVVYCACVIVWLCDGSPDQALTRRAVVALTPRPGGR